MKEEFKKVLYINMQSLTNFPYIEEDFDALTDYGLISIAIGRINDLAKNNNLQNETITEMYNNLILLKEYVDKYLVDIDDVKEEIKLINETIAVLQKAVEQNKNDIQTVRLELINLINENYNLLKDYVDYNVEMLDDKITNIQIGAINVYNPTNGLLQPLQEVINSLYEISNKDGLSATEFDALDLTATEFDAYDITAYEFDSQGKTILA